MRIDTSLYEAALNHGWPGGWYVDLRDKDTDDPICTVYANTADECDARAAEVARKLNRREGV